MLCRDPPVRVLVSASSQPWAFLRRSLRFGVGFLGLSSGESNFTAEGATLLTLIVDYRGYGLPGVEIYRSGG